MVAAVGQLMDKGEDHISPEEAALLETLAILIQADDDPQSRIQRSQVFRRQVSFSCPSPDDIEVICGWPAELRTIPVCDKYDRFY